MGPAACWLECYQKRPFSCLRAWPARCSGVTRGSARASSASWLQDARPESPTPPPRPPALPQTSGGVNRRLQGVWRCMDTTCNLLTSSGGVASGKAKWRADLLLQFKAGSSEDASSDAKLGVAWGDQPPLDLWEIAGVSLCTRLTPDLANLQDTPRPPSILPSGGSLHLVS